jgi:hypothetical protein
MEALFLVDSFLELDFFVDAVDDALGVVAAMLIMDEEVSMGVGALFFDDSFSLIFGFLVLAAAGVCTMDEPASIGVGHADDCDASWSRVEADPSAPTEVTAAGLALSENLIFELAEFAGCFEAAALGFFFPDPLFMSDNFNFGFLPLSPPPEYFFSARFISLSRNLII